MNKKFLLYFTCFTLPFNMQGAVSYKLLNTWFQASQKREAAPSPDQSNPKTYTYTPLASRAHRVQVLSEILEKRNPHEASKGQLQRLVNLFTDVGLFTNDGEKPHKTIMSRIDRTSSAAGTLALHRMASTNLAAENQELFSKRQAFVKELADNPELFNKVKGICEAWAKHENNFIANWPSKESEYSKQSFNDRYYYGKLPFTNAKAPFLDILNNELTLNVFTQGFLNTIAKPFIIDVATQMGISYIQKKYSRNPEDRQSFSSCAQNALYSLNPLEGLSFIKYVLTHSISPMSLEEYLSTMNKEPQISPIEGKTVLCPGIPVAINWKTTTGFLPEALYIFTFVKALSIASKLYSWYSAYQDFATKCEDVRYVHDKNLGLSAALESANSLQQLVSEYPIFQNAFVSSNELNSLEKEASNNKELTKLISLLKQNNTQKEVSMFWNSGQALMAHRLIDDKNQKEAFAGITEIIGEVDACLSMAKLYKQYKDEQAKYCFGNIIDQENPQFRLKGMWYPLLKVRTAVTNDFAMGGDSKSHGVITGSNTAGKSTSGLKSPLLALWFSHSLGIAPAETCESSRFDIFGSYLHVVDDPASGKSAFKAELDRVGDMVEDVEKLPKDKHAFIVLDELFRGTAPEPAEYGTTKVAEYFSKKSNVLSLLATHFKGVAEKLPHLTGNHANYRVDAEIKEDGTIERDFKIKEGISNTSIATELFKRDLGPIFEPKEEDDLPVFTEENNSQ